MKRFTVSLLVILICFVAFAQDNSDYKITPFQYKPLHTYSPYISPVNDSTQNGINYLSEFAYRQHLLMSPGIRSNPLFWNHYYKQAYSLNKIELIPYNFRILNLGQGEINNLGFSLRWSPLNRLSVEGGGFVSIQNGYTLFTHHISYGSNVIFNYDITDKFRANLWGQYVFNQNSDLFMRQMNTQPKTGVGAGIEYNPSDRMRLSVGVSKQEDIIDKKKFNIMVEGNVGITF